VAATISVAAAWVLVRFALSLLVRAIDLTLTGIIWLTTSLGSDADAWTILGVVGRALATAALSPKALALMGALLVVSAVALYGLQRLLGIKEESRQ
jgi:hypothetical protein